MKAIAATAGEGGRKDFFWLNQGFEMMTSSPVRGLGFNLRFGGIFTSVPAAVASMARPRVLPTEVITRRAESEGRGAHAPRGEGAGETAEREVGGLRLGPPTQRIDLFGLGLDYALYHKTLWGSFDQDDLSPWHRLEGVFISAPAAIAWGDNRIDVFGVGTDHAMYAKTRTGEKWTAEWLRLGGTFTSPASLVSRGATRLDLFARGADFTLRGNQTDGTTWFGWQNHGGALASPPVAVSWGPDRLDVFAIFKDGALWHRWWDGQIWNEWESLGGSYAGEPAVATWAPGRLDVFVQGASDRALHHHWFSDNTWSVPETMSIGTQQKVAESPTVITTVPNTLDVYVPVDDRQIRIVAWDGQSWQQKSSGAQFRAPSRYRMSVDLVKAKTTRAMSTDTDGAMASLAAGNAAPRIKTQWIGKMGGGLLSGAPDSSQTNLLDFEPVTVDLAEPMSFSYLVVNNGHAPQDKILAALANAGNSLSLAGSSSMQEDIAKGIVNIVSVKIIAAIAINVPVIGSILALVESWLMDQLKEAIFESCDGVVAVELRAMIGRDLFILTDNGRKTVTVTTQHPGTDSPAACGAKSHYEVTWTIMPL